MNKTANHRKTFDKNCSSICCGVPRGAALGRGSPKLNVDVKKPKGKAPTSLETSIAQALTDIENNTNELKAELRSLYIVAAREVDTTGGKKAIVIFVPFPQLQNFHKIQQRLVRELEKKFSGKHVVIIAQRKILPKPSRNNRVKRQRRPRSRTLTAVHDAILEDLVYPTEIVGRRIRVRLDNSRLFKVLLDAKDQKDVEYKLDTFQTVYKKLTGKDTQFTFPVVHQE